MIRRVALRQLVTTVGALLLCAGPVTRQAQAWVPGYPGDIAYVSDEGVSGDAAGTHIWAIASDGANKRQLTHAWDSWPSWSPNGMQIAFSRNQPSTGWRIWVMDADGRNARALTPPGTPGSDQERGNILPRWSPDGTRIAFVSAVPHWTVFDPNALPSVNLWVMNADGSHLQQITDLPPDVISGLAWSPDSQRLVFGAFNFDNDSAGRLVMYEIDPDGAHLHPLTFANIVGVDWSPLGIFFESSAIEVASSADYPLVTTTGRQGSEPSVAPSTAGSHVNTEFAYVESVRGLQVFDAPLGSEPAQQLTFDGYDHQWPSWGPALGTRFVPHVSGAAIVRAVAAGRRVIRVLVTCSGLAGGRGCVDLVRLLTGSRSLGSLTVRLRAGRERLLSVRLRGTAIRALKVGGRISLLLRTRARGHTLVSRTTSRVLAAASLTETCGATSASAGAAVRLSGSLHAAPVGARAAAPAGAAVDLIALSPRGVPEAFSTHADSQDRYSLTFVPHEPGRWLLQTVWNGDRKHVAAPSTTCAVVVQPARVPPAPPAPPVRTSLSLSCPGPATVGIAAQVSGSLTPAVADAQISVTYSRSDGSKLTDTTTTGANGSFRDEVIPDAKGTWQATATYAGDSSHLASSAPACSFVVAPSPPVATSLTLRCPGKSALNAPFQISGTLQPVFAGASITLTYSRQGKLQSSATATTDSNGGFADAATTPAVRGTWTVTAGYVGDPGHKPATAQTCNIEVS